MSRGVSAARSARRGQRGARSLAAAMRPSSPDPDSPPQVIPRPPAARPSAPGPWAALDAADRRGLSVGRVVAALDRVGWTGPVPPSADAAVEVFDGAPPGQAGRGGGGGAGR